MDARSACSGISARERYLILRPLQRKGSHSQQGGTADNSKHTELFHDLSPTSKGTFQGTKAPMFKNQIGARCCKSRAPPRQEIWSPSGSLDAPAGRKTSL